MRVVTVIKIGLSLSTLFICGCSSMQVDSWDKTVLSPTYWNTLTAEQQSKATRRQIELALARDDIKQAQMSILDSRRKKVEEDHLADLYTKVENRLLQEAEQSNTTGHPARAGLLFRMAHDIYPTSIQLKTTINLTITEINVRIEQCADKLMEKGLIAYRSGELDKAVTIWEEIGRFHPSHSSSQIAINTTKQQLKTLERLTSKNTI